MLVLTIYILTFLVGFPANVFTFATLLGKARRRISSSDILLLNLTAADLLLLLFLPFKMVEAAAGMTWPLPVVLCPVANFCFYSCIYLSSLFLTALSVERYLGVVFPLQYKDRRRPRWAMAASVVIWLLACSHCSIVFVAEYHSGRNQQPTANRSVVVGSDGSKMSNPDGFDPNRLTITGPGGFNSDGFSISNPGYSIADGFIRHSSKISDADGFNPGSSETSSPNVTDPRVFKISDRGDPETTDGAISARDGSRIAKLSGPVPKISTPKSADIRDSSSPSDASPTSDISGSPAPSVRDGSNATAAYKCYDDFTRDQLSFVLPLRLELFLVLFLLPFTVTIFCYINFVQALLARPNIPLEKKQRAVGLAVATMVNFGVCFMPYNISHVVGFVEKRSPEWRVYVLLLTSLNAALDPVIFYFSSTAVQRAVAGVAVAARDKLRVAVGWCYRAYSSDASQNESEGSLT